MTTTITFLGAADCVTGSRYLVEADSTRILVDCGLFQGLKRLRERNWAPSPLDVASLDAVVLTHAHIDHTGYLPRLRALGYRGPIHCTSGTADLAAVLLPDSGFLQEEDARRANAHGYTRHRPALPLYTQAEAEACLEQFVPHPFGESVPIAGAVRASFTRAGHIVGSACVALDTGAGVVGFTGDVGRPVDPIMKPAAPPPRADVLITESTYGDRLHADGDVAATVERVVKTTAARGGVVLVPAFAVGRAQHLMHVIAQLKAHGRIPDIPVFLDSPMAIKATKIFCANMADHRMTESACHLMCDAAEYVRTAPESRAVDRRSGPMIIIAASGMATGGRILHHLRRFAPEPRTTVLFVGHQAEGTRGRQIADGAAAVKIHGASVPVRCTVEQVPGLSAHADYREMLSWLATGDLSPRKVFVTHGELAAADAFRQRIEDTLGWDAATPEHGARVTVD
ncbi:MAG: MBL fold metallo-hydrolase [Gemmatimonadota bacterium]|nr:MBL fold metallo-hydrolase [Gemmatimonadota bacterium]